MSTSPNGFSLPFLGGISYSLTGIHTLIPFPYDDSYLLLSIITSYYFVGK